MKTQFPSEKGQAIVLIAFALVGMFALVGLAMDGGQAFSDRRQAQNAADAAALAGALDYQTTKTEANIPSIAQASASSNGYTNDGPRSVVTVAVAEVPPNSCPDGVGGKDVKVTIVSNLNTWFAPIVGITQVHNTVSSTARACNFHYEPLFLGNAVVGLNPGPDGCAFDSDTGNASWTVTGSGIFSNGCAIAKDNVTLPTEDTCVTAVGTATGFPCDHPGQTAQKYKYPEDIDKVMPPVPACDGTPDGGIIPPAIGQHDTTVTYSDGVYCIDDFDKYDSLNIILNNATLYVRDSDFKLQFSGGGGFSGTGRATGPYAGYFMVVQRSETLSPPRAPCPNFQDQNSQSMWFRGNGLGDIYGTIMAPTACIDYRGNSNGTAAHSQLVGWNVTANGGGTVYVDYVEQQNHQRAVPPSIQLVK